MSRFDWFSVLVIAVLACDIASDVSGYRERSGDNGWDWMAGLLIVAWFVVAIGGWWRT